MPRSRDRHGRGIRGPLAAPNPWTHRVVPAGHRTRTDFFADCVSAAVSDVETCCPAALTGVRVAIDDVPRVTAQTTAVPLAAAVEPRADQPAQVILFRRPLEHRASSRTGLRRLVHRMFIEQLTLLTGRSIVELAGREFYDD